MKYVMSFALIGSVIHTQGMVSLRSSHCWVLKKNSSYSWTKYIHQTTFLSKFSVGGRLFFGAVGQHTVKGGRGGSFSITFYSCYVRCDGSRQFVLPLTIVMFHEVQPLSGDSSAVENADLGSWQNGAISTEKQAGSSLSLWAVRVCVLKHSQRDCVLIVSGLCNS